MCVGIGIGVGVLCVVCWSKF